MKRVAVWLSFLVLAAIAGLIGYSFWLNNRADTAVPELSFRVDTAVAMAAHDDGFTDRLIWASKVSSFQGDGPLALAPVVAGAEVRSFSVSLDGIVRLIYEGTDLAPGRCVAADITPEGAVFTKPSDCRQI
ncbi:MAG: hypothetical protein F2520_03825 [Actinobacteria bacterium]|nr:hypothetical protein [Actinomycetota bacterium]MTA77373.1 hypothetical protein [Actinomycetota bacterium]